MHSSRMRTVCPGGSGRHTPLDRMTDACEILPCRNYVADGNNTLPQFVIVLCRSTTKYLLRFALQKKVSRIDSKHEKIERGCSSNCAGRSYVYTDTFDVHCCGEDLCNGVTSLNSTSSHLTVLVTMVICALVAVLLLTNIRS